MKRWIKTLAMIGISLGFMIVGNSKALAEPIEWSASIGGNSHFYEIIAVENNISWWDAYFAAVAKGGYLVTILSQAENQFVFDNLVNDPAYWYFDFESPFENQAAGPWIGAFQSPGSAEPAGGWQWLNNDGLLSQTYSNWLSGEPNNFGTGEPVALFYDNNLSDPPRITPKWNDWSISNTTRSYIVEYDTNPNAIPEPSTIFLLGAGLGMISFAAWRKRK